MTDSTMLSSRLAACIQKSAASKDEQIACMQQGWDPTRDACIVCLLAGLYHLYALSSWTSSQTNQLLSSLSVCAPFRITIALGLLGVSSPSCCTITSEAFTTLIIL